MIASLPGKFARIAREPRTAVWERRDPERLFGRYGRLAREAGLDDLYLVLSFDCDTMGDADVAWDVHSRLMDLGVTASYAVPGEILERGADVYRRIAETGAEFLNHGHIEHTIKRDGVYTSTLFYDQIPFAEVRADVENGHRTVTEVIGREPVGFRTPHFGTFQRPAQLKSLHGLLAGLGYLYSSSTVPLAGFRFGPAFDRYGLLEFPVSGTASMPLNILDSWGFFAAPDRLFEPSDYGREAEAVADLYRSAGGGVLSFYADPSQVHDQEVFFDAVAHWAQVARPTSYADLARSLTSRTTAAI
jgi:hypothetical protein